MKISNFLNDVYSESALYIAYRAIPSYIDGLKNSGRKCLYTVKKRNPKQEVKVSNFAGAVIDESGYIHGNTSMEGVIVTLSQEFSGSNNIPILDGVGAFGTRFVNDSAAPRYIFIKQKDYMSSIFKDADESNLIVQEFEGDKVEPMFYVPTIPMILANDSTGVGIGFASRILARSPKNIFTMVRNKIGKKELSDKLFVPYWRNFKGEIKSVEGNPLKWEIYGKIEINEKDKRKVTITELPITCQLQEYTQFLKGLKEKGEIDKFIDFSEDDNFKFEVKLSISNMNLSKDEIIKLLGLVVPITENFTCIGENNDIREFTSAKEVFNSYYKIKISFLKKRITSEIKRLTEEHKYLSELYNFITDVIKGTIKINNVKRADVENKMKELGYKNIEKLISIPAYSFTKEKADEAKNKLQVKKEELDAMKNETPESLWLKDLDELETKLKKEGLYE